MEIVKGDFNGDQMIDIASLSWENFISGSVFRHIIFLLNNGDGTFREAPKIHSSGLDGGQGVLVREGDYNSDGRVDLLFFERYKLKRLSILLNKSGALLH